VKSDYVPGHVRMPGYIRGKSGVVVGVSPPYPFPDAHGHGIEAEDEPTYDVRFDARRPVVRLGRPGLRPCRRFRELPCPGNLTP
jgi:hypothetical protein